MTSSRLTLCETENTKYTEDICGFLPCFQMMRRVYWRRVGPSRCLQVQQVAINLAEDNQISDFAREKPEGSSRKSFHAAAHTKD